MHHLVHTLAGMAAFLIVFTVLVVCLIFYFLPTAIAYTMTHRRRWWIFALNLLVGWTVVGWVVLMVWAILGDEEPEARRMRTHSTDAYDAPLDLDNV